ncbi:MAG: recombination-associated protein RdgC [Serratia sp.]|nr:recombination-associated protein RdgC [Serratia sp. (in: enterobacteria)]
MSPGGRNSTIPKSLCGYVFSNTLTRRSPVSSEDIQPTIRQTTVLNAFYNTEHHLLIVATGSKHYAGVLVSYLVKAVGSVKTETIHISDIKHGLTTKLKTYLNGDDRAFDGFQVGDFTQLSRKFEQKEVIKYSVDIDNIRDELRENLLSGYIVDSINLRYGDVSFLLTENFHFKRVDLRELADNDEDDLPYRWRHEASVATLLLTSVINTLCVLLSYKPQEKEINPQ